MNNLSIHAIEPLRLALYDAVSSLAPRLLVAALLLLGAWVIAASARWAVNRAARAEWLEWLLIRSGVFAGLVEPSLAAPRRLFANLIYFGIFLAGAASALAVLSDPVASKLNAFLLILLPSVLLGLTILLGAWWLGRYWSRSTLIWLTNEGIRFPWRWAALVRLATLASGIAIASGVTGFATLLIRSSFLILLAGATLVAAQALVPLIRIHLQPAFSSAENAGGAPEEDTPPR